MPQLRHRDVTRSSCPKGGYRLRITKIERHGGREMILLAMILGTLPIWVSTVPPSSAEPEVKMFGINLSPAAFRLVAIVEEFYGKPIREEDLENWEPSRYGEFTVADDGTPVIRINASTGRTEATIVHELLHLKLSAEGFASLVFNLESGPRNESNSAYLGWLDFHLRDPIQHWIIYPEMRRLGLRPETELRAEFEQAFANDDFKAVSAATAREARALYYLNAALLLDDPQLLARIAAWYEQKGRSQELATGKRLAQLVLELTPRTPQQEIDAFLQCANLLLGENAKFELAGWNSTRLGPHVENIALIRVEPAGQK